MWLHALRRSVILIAASVSMASVSTAALIVQDPYLIGSTPANGEYVNTNEIYLTNPTIPGWTGVWDGNGGGTNSPFGAYRSVTGSLTYGELLTSGGRLNYSRVNTSNATQKTMYRSSSDATNHSTYYASFLVNIGSEVGTHTNYNLVGLQFGTGTNSLLFGFSNISTDSSASLPFLGIVPTAQMLSDSQGAADTYSNTTTGTSSFALGSTHLIVAKIVNSGSGNEAISLYVDPTIGSLQNEPGLATLTSSIDILPDAGAPLGRMFWVSNSSASNSIIQFDEIRVGTTWADVVPVPEPSSYATLSVICMGVLYAFRRSRTVS